MLDRLLDSVILIDHFNGITAASEYLAGLASTRTAISVITRAEILVGFEKTAAERAKELLDEFQLLGIDGGTADRAAELRRNFGWKLPDAFQAALALQYNIKLVTRNTKDFDPKKHRFVEVPYTFG
jgi:predicted nucleic acid-binding protein